MSKEELVGVCITKAQGAAIESAWSSADLELCLPAKISLNNQRLNVALHFWCPKLA